MTFANDLFPLSVRNAKWATECLHCEGTIEEGDKLVEVKVHHSANGKTMTSFFLCPACMKIMIIDLMNSLYT